MTVIRPPREPLFEAARMMDWGVLLLETETVFGIATKPKNIDKIFEIKSRDYTKPLSWVFPPKSDFITNHLQPKQGDLFDSCWECSEFHKEIFDYLLTAQLSITTVIPGESKQDKCLPPASSEMGIGVRFGNFGLNQLAHLSGPYLLTSANKSGDRSPKMVEEIDDSILVKVSGFYNLNDVIIDNPIEVDEDGKFIWEEDEEPLSNWFVDQVNKYHKILKGEPSPVVLLSGNTIKTLRGSVSASVQTSMTETFSDLKFI